MKIAISAESTIDLTQDIIEKYNINIVPFHITLGDTDYEDDKITTDEIIDFVNKNKILPKTSAVNEDQFENCLLSEHFFWGAGNYNPRRVGENFFGIITY